MNSTNQLEIKILHLGEVDYISCWQAMRQRVEAIATNQQHELWVCSHQSVFTLGQASDRAHLLDVAESELVQTDRGGQVTWHGPGQIIIYPLLHLASLNLGPKILVHTLEAAVINLLADFGIAASRSENAPGVYVKDAKIASVGLRIRKGVSYHGLAFNHHNQLTPFDKINPCGYKGLKMTRMLDLCPLVDQSQTAEILLQQLVDMLQLS